MLNKLEGDPNACLDEFCLIASSFYALRTLDLLLRKLPPTPRTTRKDPGCCESPCHTNANLQNLGFFVEICDTLQSAALLTAAQAGVESTFAGRRLGFMGWV